MRTTFPVELRKFLNIDRRGNVIQRFPDMMPDDPQLVACMTKERWRNNVVSDAVTGCRDGGASASFSAAFRAGEIVHLVGPNGAGRARC